MVKKNQHKIMTEKNKETDMIIAVTKCDNENILILCTLWFYCQIF